jgi:hypothetical protein
VARHCCMAMTTKTPMRDLNAVPRADRQVEKSLLTIACRRIRASLPADARSFECLALRNHGAIALVDRSERLLGRDGR